MSDGGFSIERLFELMQVKGFTEADLAELGYNKERVDGWRYSTRRPKPPDAFKIAQWLQVPAEYLYGRASDLEGLPAWQVVTRASLDTFLKTDRTMPSEARAIFEHYADSPGAPRRAEHWKDLYERFFTPAARFGQQRWKEARKMGRSSVRPPR